MSITRYALFADEHEGHFTGFGQHERGDCVMYSEHVAELDVMHTRALKAEAIVALAAAVERGWEACNRLQNECQTDGWTGPKLLALEEARQVYMVATDALQDALAKAGEA